MFCELYNKPPPDSRSRAHVRWTLATEAPSELYATVATGMLECTTYLIVPATGQCDKKPSGAVGFFLGGPDRGSPYRSQRSLREAVVAPQRSLREAPRTRTSADVPIAACSLRGRACLGLLFLVANTTPLRGHWAGGNKSRTPWAPPRHAAGLDHRPAIHTSAAAHRPVHHATSRHA